MTKKFYKGFSTLKSEVELDQIAVKGLIPEWLTGTLIRNGPAKFEVGENRFNHWFDGLAMLHKFSFKNGTISYANKFLKSNAYKESRDKGKISYKEFATDPCYSLFGRVMTFFSPNYTDNSNVNVTEIANNFVALSEIPLQMQFDIDTLKTLDVLKYDDQITGEINSAHPQYDFNKSAVYSHIISFPSIKKLSFTSSYNFFSIPSSTKNREILASIPTKELSYIHSFGMTQNHIIFCEIPFIVNPLDILLRGKPFIENYNWKPERGTNFKVIDKNTGNVSSISHSDPFFSFHHVNSFEKNGEIFVDIAAYKDPSIIDELYLDKLLHTAGGGWMPKAELRRYRINLEASTVNYDVLSSEPIELPRINYRRCNTNEYKFVYGCGINNSNINDFHNQLVKIDVTSGNSQNWFEDGCYPGEPVFVSKPEEKSEDDGLILSVVLNSKDETSFLLVLDAGSFEEIARAMVPHHIPFGLHGQFFSSEM